MSLLLDALQRAGKGRQSPSPEPAGVVTYEASGAAQAVFRSTDGERRRARNRRALGVLFGLAVLAAGAAGGWFHWQDLRADLERDLAAYDIERAATPPDAGAAGEPVAAVDAAGEGDSEPAAADVEAERVIAEWQATVAAVEAAREPEESAAGESAAPAEAIEAGAELQAQADPAASTGHSAPEPEAEPEPEPEPESEPESESGDDEAHEQAGESTDATARAERTVTPMVRRSQTRSPLDAALHNGYQAMQEGDLRRAAQAYETALAEQPDNRDALLGAAAVAQHRGDLATARTHYARILADDPDDPHARSGLLSLDGVSDPRRSESELKLLLRKHPDSHAVHFALGNLYAAESRWGSAQEAYFEARRGDAENPNYAFNLAVALDHLGQRAAARHHYEQALELAEGRSTAFAPATARARIDALR